MKPTATTTTIRSHFVHVENFPVRTIVKKTRTAKKRTKQNITTKMWRTKQTKKVIKNNLREEDNKKKQCFFV